MSSTCPQPVAVVRGVAERTTPQKRPRRPTMEARESFPNRRDLFAATLGCSCTAFIDAQDARAQATPRDVFVERPAEGTPHKGKVLLAVQAHSDDIPLMAAGVVA